MNLFNSRQMSLNFQNKTLILDEKGIELFFSANWYMRAGYVLTTKRPFKVFHRLLVKALSGEIVDHINGNTTDNRVENLRVVTRKENCWNRGKIKKTTISAYKGVRKTKAGNWRAVITHEGKSVYNGTHKNEEQAARAYDDLARRYYGKFARTNF